MQWSNWLWVVGFYFCFCNANAQNGDELIQSLYDSSRTISSDTDFNPPYIEEINMRTETRDWHLNRQRYSLRLSPLSLRERRSAMSLHKHWREELQIIKDKFIADRVRSVHEDYVSVYFEQKSLENINEEIILIDDLIKVNETLSENEPEKLLEVYDLRELKMQLISKLSKLTQSIKLSYNKLFNGEVEDVPLVVESYVETIAQVIVNPEKARLTLTDSYKINEIELETENEIAEESRVLDFVQLQYRGPHMEPWQERWSVGVSANLPFFSSNRLSIAKLKVEKEKEILRNELDLEERQAKIDAIIIMLKEALYDYQEHIRIGQVYETERRILMEKLMDAQIISPIIAIQDKRKRIAKIRNRITLENNLLNLYIKYLDETQRYTFPLSHIVKAPK